MSRGDKQINRASIDALKKIRRNRTTGDALNLDD
jgi:hypothetical protein